MHCIYWLSLNSYSFQHWYQIPTFHYNIFWWNHYSLLLYNILLFKMNLSVLKRFCLKLPQYCVVMSSMMMCSSLGNIFMRILMFSFWDVRWKNLFMKSSRLFPLSYLFQKNQYKCDIVPSLPTGLRGIEPVEHAPVWVHPRIGPFNAVSLLVKQFIK